MAGEENSEDKTPREASPDDVNRKRLRTLIIGTLAAGGAFQLNGWQVQAHGNRSSHGVAALRTSVFRPEDYILLRQQITAPDAEDTLALALVTKRLDDAMAKGASRTTATEVKTLIDTKADLEDRLRFRTTSKRALDFVHDGDVDAAAAVIEGQGQPERVLYEYHWALMDLAYDARQGPSPPPPVPSKTANPQANMRDFTALAQRAYAYSQHTLATLPAQNLNPQEAGLQLQVAEIYHNIASFTVPEAGPIPEFARDIGRKAALDSLALRQRMNQPHETMIANWMVGRHFEASGDPAQARDYYVKSIGQAQALSDDIGVAWGKTSLASLAKNNPKLAIQSVELAGFDSQVDQTLARADSKSALAQLLRLDRAAKR